MRNKLIAAGAGLFGFGVLWGWSIGTDLANKKAKDTTDTLIDVVERQAGKLEFLNELLESIPMTEEELAQITNDRHEPEVTQEDVVDWSGQLPDVGTTPDGRVAYSNTDEVVERPIPPGETPAKTEKNLRRLIDNYVANEDEIEAFTSQVLAHDDSDKTPPFVIPQETYALEKDDEGTVYDKMPLTYYPHERVLVNDDEETEDDIDSIIGLTSLNSFGANNDGDPNVVYVRNTWLRTDFEVYRETESKPPLHVLYGMPKEQFAVQRAAGQLRVRPEDE